MKIKKTYLPVKTLTKFLIILAEVLVAGLLIYLTENDIYIMVVPLLEALRNFLKHGITK